MTDIINLRTVRKRAKRLAEDQHADAQRLTHGQTIETRKLEAARRQRAERVLAGHKRETGDRP